MASIAQTDFQIPSLARHAVSPWLIAFTVMLSTFMEVLDTSIANVALPHIAGSLSFRCRRKHLGSHIVSRFQCHRPSVDRLVFEAFGRKRFYITCVLTFIVSSLLCGAAPSLPLLVLFRVLQGAAGGGLQPVSQAILVESFPREKQGMAMAVYGMGVVVAPIIGPTLGGWITDNYSWRWIFFINIPVGLLSVFLTSTLIQDPPHLSGKNKEKVRIDYVGLGLLSVGLGFLQVVLDKGQRDDWFSSNFIIWSSVAAVLGLVGAFLWELKQENPVIELHLFKDRNYAAATFTMFSLGIILYGTTVMLPVLLQTLMGYTAQLSGYALSPGAMVTLVGLPLVGWLLVRIHARWLVIFGLVGSFDWYVRARQAQSLQRLWTFVFMWTISSGALAFLFVPINVTAFAFVPKERMNSATGLINLARNIGGSVGISLVTTLQVRLAQRHQWNLVDHLSPLNPRYTEALQGAAAALRAHGSDAATALHQAQALIYYELQRQSAMLAFIDVFWILGVACLAMIPLMFIIRSERHDAPHLPVH